MGMQVDFFDDHLRIDLFPLTLTRPCAELRCGILTIAEKWKHALGLSGVGYKTESYLQAVFSIRQCRYSHQWTGSTQSRID